MASIRKRISRQMFLTAFFLLVVPSLVLAASSIVDLNNDGVTDIRDLSILLSNWGRSGTNLPADINHDGTVDNNDLDQLQVSFKTSPVNSSVASLYVNPNVPAATQASAWATSRPADAAIMRRLASYPIAEWYGDWTADVTAATNSYVTQAAAQNQIPVLVAYNIPGRDCSQYSAGGAQNYTDYATWIQNFANGVGKRQAIVILEPDALAGLDCLSSADQTARIQALADAVTRLGSTTAASIYLDAGNPNWQSATTMANRLKSANIASATGFSLNVSNFYPTNLNVSYGNSVSALTGNKHYIIDTGRNGNGSNGQWCNPTGRAFGDYPTLQTNVPLVDAYLWIKRVGASDGTCNGGPAAGTWWPDYALDLAHNSGW